MSREQIVGVCIVVGAAFLLWGAAPRLVSYALGMILVVLLINKRAELKTLIYGVGNYKVK